MGKISIVVSVGGFASFPDFRQCLNAPNEEAE